MALLTLAKRSTVALGLLAAGIVLVPWAGAEQVPAPKEAPKPEVKAAPKPDAERIQGMWVVESVTGKGIADDVRGQAIAFDGTSLMAAKWLPGGKQTYRLDPTKPVKHIDLELEGVPEGIRLVTWKIEGVYEFSGDELRLGFGDLDKGGRPTSLSGKEGGPVCLLTLRRQTKLDTEREQLKGVWQPARSRAWKADEIRYGQLGITDADFRMAVDSESLHGSYTLDVSTSPRQIDIKLTEDWAGRRKGDTVQGIYDLDGDQLAVAIGTGSRPSSFRQNESNPYVFAFKRQTEFRPHEAGRLSFPPKPIEKPPVAVKGAPEIRTKIRQLQEERVKALRTQVEGQFERVKIGRDPLIVLLDCRRELWVVETALAADHAGKLKANEEYVRDLKTIEDQLVQLRDAGLQTQQGVAQGKAARLKAEIELEKLKAEKQ